MEKQHGIPSYSEANHPKIDKFRINPDSPSDYCTDFLDREKPGFDEIADLAKKCKNIEKFNQWLSYYENTAKPLSEDALAFEELLAKPSYKEFLEASIGFFCSCYKPASIFGNEFDPEWNARIPLWSKTIWNNENPIDRMSRISLPIGLPKLEAFLKIGLEQPEPCLEFLSSSLNAYCASYAKLGGMHTKKAAMRGALNASQAIKTLPDLVLTLNPDALSFFEMDLEPIEAHGSQAAYAMAEALWLRAQSLIARPDQRTAQPKRQTSL